ncbi:MAG: hypothetical protein H0V17_08940 [Deltaproteobacteria bacterium]|nr:hypothetical protein [Deltaproteobacteria bacterium]
MGLATTPEYDELLARGYPHLRRLITPHPHEADAQGWAIKALEELDPKHYFVDWPAAVARAYVRGYATSRIENTSHVKTHAAAVDIGPIDEAEGRKLIASCLGPKHYDRYDFHSEHALFLIEAMIGSAAVVDAVLGEFETMKDLEAQFGTRNAFGYAIGFVIRRLPQARRAAAEARVSALVAKHAGAGEKYTRDFLSYVTGGRAALETSGRKLRLYCVHFCEDPALIRQVATESVVGWDAHHVVLAGDGMIDALTPKAVKKIWKGHKERTIEQLGILASPKAVGVLKEFGKTKAYAAQVEAALAARSGGGSSTPQAASAKPKSKPAAKPKTKATKLAAKPTKPKPTKR